MSAERLFVENLRVIDDTIRLVCRKNNCAPNEREDFSAHARLKLIEDDYAVLRKFAGRCSLRTYLVTVVGHLLHDYRRQCWGTWRPSAEAHRLGPAAVQLDILLHRDRVPREEAVERVCARPGSTETRDQLARLAERLSPHYPRIMEGEDALEGLAAPKDGADGGLRRHESAAVSRSAREALVACMAELADEDRVILRLRYQDGLTVPRISQMLGLDQRDVYNRCTRLLKKLRGMLEGRGIDGSAVMGCLGEDSWPDDDDGEGSH
jgi:RNA polymerase sigma factor (sigma-70 family)